jgi:hypothetical protein
MTPTPEAVPGSGAGPAVTVGWQVSTDPGFGAVVRSGEVVTGPERDHTVRVDVRGLAPATTYWFRFTAGGSWSPTGRTLTAPATDAAVALLRFGVVSCSNWEAGYFASYRLLAERGDLHAVVHLGDYLYCVRAANPHVKWAELEGHGFGVHEVRPGSCRMDWFHVRDRTSRTTTARRIAGYTVDSGVARLHAVWCPGQPRSGGRPVAGHGRPEGVRLPLPPCCDRRPQGGVEAPHRVPAVVGVDGAAEAAAVAGPRDVGGPTQDTVQVRACEVSRGLGGSGESLRPVPVHGVGQAPVPEAVHDG